MEKCWNLRVGEQCWRAVKQMALDEGITVREVVERAVHRAASGAPGLAPRPFPRTAMTPEKPLVPRQRGVITDIQGSDERQLDDSEEFRQ